jgi:MFS family permease
VLATIGGALQAGSVTLSMFIVFRFVNGLGVGMLLSLVPLYQSEVSPPHSRGMMVGFHGICVTVGYATARYEVPVLLSVKTLNLTTVPVGSGSASTLSTLAELNGAYR